MIEYLRGNVIKRHSKGIVLESSGVGYGLEVPLGALCEITPGQKDVSFWVHTKVREDQLKLFGFTTWEEKEAFEILISLNGVGPKVALAILSTMSLALLKNCVENKRVDLLQMVPGIGKRTAEKMLVELNAKIDKIADLGSTTSFTEIVAAQKTLDFDSSESGSDSESKAIELKRTEVFADVKSALLNLGFKEKDISKVSAVANLSELSEDELEFSSVLRKSLIELRGSMSGGAGSKVKKAKAPATVKVEDETQLF